MARIYASIDNKNLLEDNFEDDVFQDFYAAPDHRHGTMRHLIGRHSEWAKYIGGAIVDVRWTFGDNDVSIKVLACNPYQDFDEVVGEVFASVADTFWEWECEDNPGLRVELKLVDDTITVSFWYEVTP